MRATILSLILMAAVVVVYHPVLELGLLGHDAYPILVASQVDSVGDFFGILTRKLMDGRYASDFWRPLLSMSIALEQKIWGLEPRGYQIVNLALFMGCTLALFALARRLCGPGSWAPLLAGLIFVLTPLQYEVLPVFARRPETMACTFAALALWRTLSPKVLALGRPSLMVAGFALLGMMAKETALLTVPLAWIAVALYSPRSGWRARLRHAWLGSLAPLLAAAVVLGFRFTVIGGMGGHSHSGTDKLVNALPIARRLIIPFRFQLDAPWLSWLWIGLGVSWVLALLLSFKRGSDGGSDGEPRPPRPASLLRVVVFGVAWVVAMIAIHAYAGGSAWYFTFPFAGTALVAAALLEQGRVWLLQHRFLPLRLVAIPCSLFVLGVVGLQLRYSPLLHDYPEWRVAEQHRAQVLNRLERDIRAAPQQGRLRLRPLPLEVSGAHVTGYDRPRLYGASILSDYSVQAWAELEFPDRKFQMIGLTRGMRPPAIPAGTLQVLFQGVRVAPRPDAAGTD